MQCSDCGKEVQYGVGPPDGDIEAVHCRCLRPNIKRKKCDLHEVLHPEDIECPLCDNTAIRCTCGLILFWDAAKEHFKKYRNHPYQIHVPVETKKREKEEK